MNKQAVLDATRHDASLARLEYRASPVEPEPIHLLRWTMTTNTILLKDGQDISAKVDFVVSLSVNAVCECRNQKKYHRTRVLEHDASCRICPILRSDVGAGNEIAAANCGGFKDVQSLLVLFCRRA
jgi:hypothetical protein